MQSCRGGYLLPGFWVGQKCHGHHYLRAENIFRSVNIALVIELELVWAR